MKKLLFVVLWVGLCVGCASNKQDITRFNEQNLELVDDTDIQVNGWALRQSRSIADIYRCSMQTLDGPYRFVMGDDFRLRLRGNFPRFSSLYLVIGDIEIHKTSLPTNSENSERTLAFDGAESGRLIKAMQAEEQLFLYIVNNSNDAVIEQHWDVSEFSEVYEKQRECLGKFTYE